jgi:type IV pilus assembly protein PilV
MITNKKQSGFSLLEIMIAVLILSIGLLGMAAMQAVALSSNQEAQFRIQALAIAEDLSSRMRANREYVNANIHKYPGIPADHDGYNVYSDITNWDYNAAAPASAFEATNVLLGSPSTDIANINLRAQLDVQDIRRQLKPTSGLLLPTDSLMFVDCNDKANLDYTTLDTDPDDNCSPGSVYTIYVLWPVSSGRADAGQTEVVGGVTVNRDNINGRCRTRLATHDNTLSSRNYACVIMDLVP